MGCNGWGTPKVTDKHPEPVSLSLDWALPASLDQVPGAQLLPQPSPSLLPGLPSATHRAEGRGQSPTVV